MSEDKQPKAPTEQEIKERNEKLKKFYNEQIPFLKKQAEYEELLTKIEMAKMTRFEIMITKAQMMNGPQEEQPQSQQSEGKKPTEHMRPVNKDNDQKPKGKRKLKNA